MGKAVTFVQNFLEKYVFSRIAADIEATIGAIWALVILYEANMPETGQGPARAKKIVDDLMAEYDKEGGIDIPKGVGPWIRQLLPILIEAVFSIFKNRGNS